MLFQSLGTEVTTEHHAERETGVESNASMDEAHVVKTGDGSMKKNQPDPEPDADGIEPARLASFGVLVGLLIVGCIVLVLTLSSGGGTPPAPEVKSEARTAVEVRDDATATQQRATAVPIPEPPKPTVNKPETGKRRAGAPSSSKAAKSAKPYIISVAPGRTPRMTQVQ